MQTITDAVVCVRAHRKYQSRATGRNFCKADIAANSVGSALKIAKLAIRPPVQQELAGRCVAALRELVGLCTSFSDSIWVIIASLQVFTIPGGCIVRPYGKLYVWFASLAICGVAGIHSYRAQIETSGLNFL